MTTITEPIPAQRPAGATFRQLHPLRRRPHHVFLIDSMLFRVLCFGTGDRLGEFRTALARHGFAPGGELPDLQLTPFGVLAALGIEPPPFDTFPLPQKVVQVGESATIATLLVQLIVKHFRDAPKIKPEALRKCVDELRNVAAPKTHELFDLCLSRVVAGDEMAERIYSHLAFDTLYRFPFPEAVREDMFHFLWASLFAGGESVSGLSKMRMVKMIWDRAYERLLRANPTARAEIQGLDREMKLRNRQDFLDWEVIHHAILGFGKDRVQPVTAFTLLTDEKARSHCIAYKSALRAFLDQIDRDDLINMRPQLSAWRPGEVVPCSLEGTFEEPIATGPLQVFTAGKDAAEKLRM